MDGYLAGVAIGMQSPEADNGRLCDVLCIQVRVSADNPTRERLERIAVDCVQCGHLVPSESEGDGDSQTLSGSDESANRYTRPVFVSP